MLKTSKTQHQQPRGRRRRHAMIVILSVVISALGYAVVLCFIPQSLNDVDGAADTSWHSGRRDMVAVFRRALEHNYAIHLSEQEVNHFLTRTLQCHQGGVLARWIKLDRVLVRLESGRAEIILLRHCFGWAHTVSMWVQLEQTEDSNGERRTQVHFNGGPLIGESAVRRGGRIGQLVIPEGLLRFILPSYISLVKQFETEIHYGFEEMANFEFRDGMLSIDPSKTDHASDAPFDPLLR